MRPEPALFAGQYPANQVPFARNANGHIVLSLSPDSALSGEEEITRMSQEGILVLGLARMCLRAEDYARHHLILARCQVVLVPTDQHKRTFAGLCKIGEDYRYRRPQAGIMPHILRLEQTRELGFRFIGAPHKPIAADGTPLVLRAEYDKQGCVLTADTGYPHHEWEATGAFAFLVGN